jgi:hypothetical protein
MSRHRLVRWLLCGALAIHAPVALVAIMVARLPSPDFDNYYAIGTRPGRPYVDFQAEFPVATVQAFRFLAPLAGDRERFGVDLVILNVAADLAIAGALAWCWGIEAAACYALVVAPILDLFLLRLDLWSTALATIGVAAWRRDHAAPAALAFVSGAAFKLWPLAFLPLVLVPSRTRGRAAPVATTAAAGLIVLVAWLCVAGPRGLYQVLTFRGARGWEVESTVGAVWTLIDRRSMRLESGAWRIGTTSGPISILLLMLGAAPCSWMVWRARTRHVGAGWPAASARSWRVPPPVPAVRVPDGSAAGVAWAEGDTRVATLTALAVFSSKLAWKSFTPLLRGEAGAIAIVIARNLLLAGLALVAARLVARASEARAASDQRVGEREHFLR